MTDPATAATIPHESGDFSIGGSLWPGLSKLIEECGEVLQVGGKLIGSEGRTDHWSGDLNQMLVDELGDLLAALRFFMEANNIDTSSVAARQRRKLAVFWEWHRQGLAVRAILQEQSNG
ncbi:MAG: hypothetical protein A3E01_09105 [Gammaproteobacteria bacterium RIFCSPHIGHO2_12_FULL_63_22]|nr:MAG: hypothetical protein A3E01_09105 [Gammaproteobacteria bacterium RIFCSPHIGHO2_12_FULL_63_22]